MNKNFHRSGRAASPQLSPALVSRALGSRVFKNFPAVPLEGYALSEDKQLTFQAYTLRGGSGITCLLGLDLMENIFVTDWGMVEARYALHGVATTDDGEKVVFTSWAKSRRFGLVRTWEDVTAIAPKVRKFLEWNQEREEAEKTAWAAVDSA